MHKSREDKNINLSLTELKDAAADQDGVTKSRYFAIPDYWTIRSSDFSDTRWFLGMYVNFKNIFELFWFVSVCHWPILKLFFLRNQLDDP